jgi:hypothetical protein
VPAFSGTRDLTLAGWLICSQSPIGHGRLRGTSSCATSPVSFHCSKPSFRWSSFQILAGMEPDYAILRSRCLHPFSVRKISILVSLTQSGNRLVVRAWFAGVRYRRSSLVVVAGIWNLLETLIFSQQPAFPCVSWPYLASFQLFEKADSELLDAGHDLTFRPRSCDVDLDYWYKNVRFSLPIQLWTYSILSSAICLWVKLKACK